MVVGKRMTTWGGFPGVKTVLQFSPAKRRSEPEKTSEEATVESNNMKRDILEQENIREATIIDELLDAAKEGNLADVCRICEVAEIDPDARGYMGWTAAHWAAREGHIHILEYLCQIGANLDTLDRKGDCLLHKAAANGQHEVCAWLLQHNFNVHAVNNNGMTPIDLVREKARSSRNSSTTLCEALLVKECDCTF